MSLAELPPSSRLKLELMFEGVRYSEALGRAAEHSFPNYYPYRFAPGEHDPTGEGAAPIPYMFVTPDDTHICIRPSPTSRWSVSGSRETGYALLRDESSESRPIDFEPTQPWTAGTTHDGLPFGQAGLDVHGDMAVINIAPGCEYFLERSQDGEPMRCTFCRYGAPKRRARRLGQVMGEPAIPESAYRRLQEVLSAALEPSTLRHLYLVGGSLTDPREEGARYAELARRVQEVNDRRIPVTCGSGALPEESLRVLHRERLVDGLSFNLEVWSEPLFARICPGKQRFVGYRRWIESLETGVRLWGRGRVYTAMVAGVELDPGIGLSTEQALETALRGAEDLCGRGILPVYSLYWPTPGRDFPAHLQGLDDWFARLQLGYARIRRRAGLEIWDGFMCHRCAYMQLECDLDRAAAGGAA